LKLGETPYRLTRIGTGKKDETVVFGLRKQDKKMLSGLGGVALFDRTAEGISDVFYGEVIGDGRIHVFNRWNDLKAFLDVGEAPYRYTDIGAGPNGEAVVDVLNKDNKKNKPIKLIQQIKLIQNRSILFKLNPPLHDVSRQKSEPLFG